MKNILYLLRSLGLYKLLTGAGIAAMLLLLFLGPTMLRSSDRHIASAPTNTTAPAASTKATGTSNGSAAGLDPSTFNVTPVTMPDGSITFPSYTVPTTTTKTPTGTTTIASPDPDKCAAAHAAMDTIDASYVDVDAQLRTNITNYQNFLINNSKTYVARGYGPNADEQAADTRVNTAMQNDNNTLMGNVRDMNSKKAPYQTIIVQNQCS